MPIPGSPVTKTTRPVAQSRRVPRLGERGQCLSALEELHGSTINRFGRQLSSLRRRARTVYRRRVIRFLVRTAVALASNAVGLLVAGALLDGFEIHAGGFLLAVVIFTVTMALLMPFLAVQLRRMGSGALGGVALIASLASLILTVVISDGLSIDGVGTWLAGAVIVWAASVLAFFILPYLGLKKYLEER